MKIKLILLSTILLISCGNNEKEIERFRKSATIGKLTYQNIFIKVIREYDTITLIKAVKISDSIYEVELNKTIKTIYYEN